MAEVMFCDTWLNLEYLNNHTVGMLYMKPPNPREWIKTALATCMLLFLSNDHLSVILITRVIPYTSTIGKVEVVDVTVSIRATRSIDTNAKSLHCCT